MATLKNTIIDDTGYLKPATGDTGQRPISPNAGMVRWNTDKKRLEVYNGNFWKSLSKGSIIYDHFQGTTLNNSIWSTFGTANGTITISDGVCTINNDTGDSNTRIGIYSNLTFGVGMTLTVRSRNTSGRHCALIGFGESTWAPYPHTSTNGSKGVTWYSRNDNASSTLSWRNDNNVASVDDSLTEDLRDWQIFKIERLTSSKVKVYRNDILEATINDTFANNYSVYFSTDGWYNPATIEIDWVKVQ